MKKVLPLLLLCLSAQMALAQDVAALVGVSKEDGTGQTFWFSRVGVSQQLAPMKGQYWLRAGDKWLYASVEKDRRELWLGGQRIADLNKEWRSEFTYLSPAIAGFVSAPALGSESVWRNQRWDKPEPAPVQDFPSGPRANELLQLVTDALDRRDYDPVRWGLQRVGADVEVVLPKPDSRLSEVIRVLFPAEYEPLRKAWASFKSRWNDPVALEIDRRSELAAGLHQGRLSVSDFRQQRLGRELVFRIGSFRRLVTVQFFDRGDIRSLTQDALAQKPPIVPAESQARIN